MSSRPATLRSEEGGREPRWRKAPEGREYLISTGALASPGYEGDRGGNAGHDYKRGGIPFQPRKRGAVRSGSAPLLPFPSVPTRGRGRSAIATMKLRLG